MEKRHFYSFANEMVCKIEKYLLIKNRIYKNKMIVKYKRNFSFFKRFFGIFLSFFAIIILSLLMVVKALASIKNRLSNITEIEKLIKYENIPILRFFFINDNTINQIA